MSRFLPHPIMALVLLVVWVLLMDSIAPGVVLVGIVLSLVIVHWSAAFWPQRPRVRRLGVIVRFVPLVLWDIVVANLIVAKLILGPKSKLRPRFLAIPLDLQDPNGLVILASVITLTPGTVSSEFSPDRRTLFVHGLDVEDTEAAIRDIKQRYEAPLMEIFPCSPSR